MNPPEVPTCRDGIPVWRTAGHRYYGYNYYLRARFGERVQRVSVDAGFSCPNVDGTVAVGGCTFCDNRSFSPSRRAPRMSITDQIDDGIRRLKRRYRCRKFLAYFQPATNTYAPAARLAAVYGEALRHPDIVGLAIGTRPDCVDPPILELLAGLAGTTYVSLEYGIQTIHNRSLDWMNRGHPYEVVPGAIAATRGRGIEIGGHVILGLPGESHADMMATAQEMARLDLDSIKIHNLYAVKDTPLAEQVARGEVQLFRRADYIRTLVDFLEWLPPGMVVERVSGESPDRYFIGPSWCLDKPGILTALREELERRDTWQGRKYQRPS